MKQLVTLCTFMKAFILGVCEFKSSVTTNFTRKKLAYYEAGRELAHILTLRVFDN